MYAGQFKEIKRIKPLTRPSTGVAFEREKQFYHQNVDISYIEKDLYIQGMDGETEH
jgi:hypothetical protein